MLFFLAILAIWLLFIDTEKEDGLEHQSISFLKLRHLRSLLVFTFIAYFVVMLFVSWGVPGRKDSYISYTEVSEKLGLKSGQAYPIDISNSRVVSGEISGWFGLGFGSIDGNISSSIPISFTINERTYMLEVPISKITFVQKDTDNPSAVFYLDSDVYGYLGEDQPAGSGVLVMGNLVPIRIEGYYRELYLYDETIQSGLAPIIDESLNSVEITLTPEMYAEVFGKIE